MKSPDSERKFQALTSSGKSIGEILIGIRERSEDEPNALMSTSGKDPVFASVPETFGSPVLADVNGDGSVDIIARAGYLLATGYERVFAWDYEGNLIPGWPLYASDEPSPATPNPYTPAMADMDKDGKLDMVVGTPYNISSTPEVVSWEFDTYYDYTTMHWPRYMHDKWNSGVSDLQTCTDVKEEDEEIKVPASFSLNQNYPNPFNPETKIEYFLPKETQVRIDIFNIIGQRVKTLVNQRETAGHKKVIWDGKNERGEAVSSGIYFYRLEADNFTQTRKMILMK